MNEFKNNFFKSANDKKNEVRCYFIDDWRRMQMIKQMAWNTFKNTGDINTFMELVEIKNIEKNLKVNEYGDNKDEGDSNIRE